MKIFISHSHNDRQLVNTLASELIRRGFYLWVDQYELEPNQTLDTSIHIAIEECSHFCIVLSASSVNSEWCLNELKIALEKEKQEQRVCVYLLLLDDCKLPELIKDRLSIDFRSSFKEGLDKFLFYLNKDKDYSNGRLYDGLYKRDFAKDSGLVEFKPHGKFYMMEVTSVSFEPNKNYSILATLTFMGQEDSVVLYEKFISNNEEDKLNQIIEQLAHSTVRKNPRKYILVLKDGKKVKDTLEMYCSQYNLTITLVTEARILGELPDTDVHFDYGSIVEAINK